MTPPRIRDIAGPIEAAIRKAADRTGVDFGFLLKTARRESSLNPAARAKTSSAAGLFQFIEQTWLGQLKRHGAKHGYGRYAEMIQRGKDGRLHVNGEAGRKAIMDLRFDPACSALMAGELASDHASYLKGRIGREANGGELYAAHFLGPRGAARLIEAHERNPGATAASLFPAAAAANKSIFYRKGRACSVSEVYAHMMSTVGEGAAARPAKAAPASKPEAPGVAYAAFSLNERLERIRQERSLMDRVLSGSSGGILGPRLDTEILSMLSAARDEDG